jgi:hypothetical protein
MGSFGLFDYALLWTDRRSIKDCDDAIVDHRLVYRQSSHLRPAL